MFDGEGRLVEEGGCYGGDFSLEKREYKEKNSSDKEIMLRITKNK